MKIKDLQFPRYFLLNEIDINPSIAAQILETEISVRSMGEPDTVITKGNKILISEPSSLTRFLFNALYHTIKPHVVPGFQQDKLVLSLLHICKDYVYSDYDHHVHLDKVPIIVSLEKFSTLSILLQDIVEPIMGKITPPEILFVNSSIIDSCMILRSSQELSNSFGFSNVNMSYKYPILVASYAIHNHAAQFAHIFANALKLCYNDKAEKLIKRILLDNKNNILNNVISVLKITEGEPVFIADFLKYLKSSVTLSHAENQSMAELYANSTGQDNYLKNRIKVAGPNYTPQVFKQWHQWSMIMGLIEKQLQPMRGSMWPATENVKPFEDNFRNMLAERSKKKNKTQLNMEEMLEVARELYEHRAVQPGNLYESLLKENRIWKS